MDGVHFGKGCQLQSAEIVISPANKDGTLLDLCLMTLSRLELYLPFQIDIPAAEHPHIDVGIEGPDRHIQFRMVCNDLIGRLPLKDQRSNDLVLLPQIMFGKVNAGSGFAKALIVFAVSDPGVVKIPDGNGAAYSCLIAAIAHIGSFLQMVTVFTLKIRTGLVTGGA
jgi:hypothetical protein